MDRGPENSRCGAWQGGADISSGPSLRIKLCPSERPAHGTLEVDQQGESPQPHFTGVLSWKKLALWPPSGSQTPAGRGVGVGQGGVEEHRSLQLAQGELPQVGGWSSPQVGPPSPHLGGAGGLQTEHQGLSWWVAGAQGELGSC